MTANEGAGSVLIVATDRDDRRVLFDALDAQEFDAIYTAKDVSQARAFLEQDPQIDLVLLEFAEDTRAALAFCTELRQYHPGAPVPLVIMTHSAVEASVRAAIDEIDSLDAVRAPSVCLGVEE